MTAVTRRSRAASLGKMPTTLVRRLISPWSRSSGLVDQILRQCAVGNALNAEQVLAGVGEHVGDDGELAGEHRGDLVELGGDVCSASGWAKIVRIAAATISRGGLGDLGEHVAHEVHAAALPCTRR